MIEIEIQEHTLSRYDYIKLHLILTIHNWGFYTFLAIILVLTALCLSANISVTFPLVIVGLVILYLIGIALYMGVSPQNRNFFLLRNYVFSEHDVLVNTPIGQSTYKWDAFVNWKKVAGFYLIYASRMTFYPVPVSLIPYRELSEFEALLRSKIKSHRGKRLAWRMKGLLALDVLISLWWLFGVYGAHLNEFGFFASLPVYLLIVLLFAPVALLLTEFGLLVSRSRSVSRKTTLILLILHLLTFVGMLFWPFYLWVI